MMWSRWHQPNRPKPKPKTKGMRSSPPTPKDPPLTIEEIRRRGSIMAGGPSRQAGEGLFAVPQRAATVTQKTDESRRVLKGPGGKPSR